MPHFTVVPVKDQAQSNYDSLEGINWVNYKDTGQDCHDQQDVSSDGESTLCLLVRTTVYVTWTFFLLLTKS